MTPTRWMTLYRKPGQRQWRRTRLGATPATHAVLTINGTVLAEIAIVELPAGGTARDARAVMVEMERRGRVRRACDPGRVTRVPLAAQSQPSRGAEEPNDRERV